MCVARCVLSVGGVLRGVWCVVLDMGRVLRGAWRMLLDAYREVCWEMGGVNC